MNLIVKSYFKGQFNSRYEIVVYFSAHQFLYQISNCIRIQLNTKIDDKRIIMIIRR